MDAEDKLKKRLQGMKYDFEFDQSSVDMISEVGYDETYGARPLKRAIQDKIEDYLSEEILKGELKEGLEYLVKYKDDKVVVDKNK